MRRFLSTAVAFIMLLAILPCVSVKGEAEAYKLIDTGYEIISYGISANERYSISIKDGVIYYSKIKIVDGKEQSVIINTYNDNMVSLFSINSLSQSRDLIISEAAKLIIQNEGSYGSVNKNDKDEKGNSYGMSIGKFQWNSYWGNALPLLQTIVSANPTNAKAILGDTLYNEIANNPSSYWNRKSRIATNDEAARISKLLVTAEGMAAQDALIVKDATSYVDTGINLGIESGPALVYYADLRNQFGGSSDTMAKNASVTAGGYDKITLSGLHQAALNYSSSYNTRRNDSYNYVTALGWDDVKNTIPTVSLSTDLGGTVKIGKTVNITANVSDSSNVKIFINYWGENGSAWEYEVGANYPASRTRSWDTSSCKKGIYKIVAKAIDSSGNFITGGESETITVNLETLDCLLEMENHSYYNSIGKKITFNASCESGYDFIKIFIKQNGSEIDGPANKGTSRTWDSTGRSGLFSAQASAFVGDKIVAQSNIIEFVVGSAPEVSSYKETMDTPVSATIEGFVELDNGYAITEYGFFYGKSSDTSKMTKVKVGDNIAKHIPFTLYLDDLDYGTTYYYRAYAASKMGIGYGELYSFTTEAYSEELSGGFIIEDGILTGYFGSGGAITIPSNVTRIEEYAFEDNNNITSVVIPETVTSIASHAFYGCTALKNASINADISTLSSYAFAKCTALETVTMSNLTGIGRSAFYGDTALKTVTIPYSVTGILESSFEYSKDGEKVPLEGLTIRGYTSSYAEYFAIKNNYTFISLGESPNAGKGDSQETAIDITTDWSVSGSYDVETSRSLKYYKFTPTISAKYTVSTSYMNDGLGLYVYRYGSSEKIASDYENEGGYKLTASFDAIAGTTYIIKMDFIGDLDENYTLTLGYEYTSENFTYMIYKEHAIITAYSGSDKKVVIPSSVVGKRVTEFYNDTVFEENETIESVTIPNTIEKVWYWSFDGCTNLKTVKFESGSIVTELKQYTFSGCENLTDIVWPEKLELIGSSAFGGCAFSEIKLPETLTTIEKNAFDWCENLNSIVIPKSVKSIGRNAFAYCSNLRTVTVENRNTIFGSSVFDNCPAVTLRGYTGSTAQSYASQYSNVTFEAIDGISVSYDANGGSGAPTEQSATMGVSVKLSETIPVRAGYTFKGWYSADDPTKLYAAGSSFMADKDTVLYASWASAKYTIQYKTNTGTSIASITVSSGEAVTLNASAPAVTGYTLSGWSRTIGSTSAEYAVNEQISVTGNITLYTVYVANKYTVTFNSNGGICGIANTMIVYGDQYGELPEPSRSGYTFDGWSTAITGGEIIASDTVAKTPADHTLYALWSKNFVPVSQIEIVPSEIVLREGERFTLSADIYPENATDKNITWASLNESVATVDNGVVKAVKAGSATITVTTADGGKTASCEVTVEGMPAQYSADITVGNASGRAGDTVTVPVVISNNPGIAALKIKVTYDKEKLVPVSIAKGSILSGAITSNIQQGGDMTRFDYVTVYWDNPSDFTADGELFNVVFKIADSAEEGDIPVGVSYVKGEVANQKYEDVDINVTEGNVSVKNVMMGDIFEDGEVNSKDGLKLRQYLAEWAVNLSAREKAAADVFKDGEINSKDGLKLRQYLAEWDVSLEMMSLMDSGSISFEAGSASAASGEYVDIPINITENSGVAVFNLRVEFDKEKLIPVSITKGDALEGVITSNIQQGGDMERFDYVTAYWDNPSNATGTGTAFTVRFKVKDGAEGEAPIRLTSKAGDICDQSFNDLDVKFTDGAVTVDAVKDAVAVIIDSVETNYGTFSEAVNAANSAGKAVELKVLVNLDSASIESEYKHIINLNSNTVNELNIAGETVIKNGTVNTLNVTGIAVTENVAVESTNAACSGTEGTKSVYTSHALGVSMINGAQVRVGGGLTEDGTIDSKSGLRFIATCDKSDTFAGQVLDRHYANNTYAEGYGIGVAIGAEDSEKVIYIPATKWQDADQSVFTAAITSLASSNFNRKLTARAYVEYDGVKLYSAESSTRSMYQVAAGLLKNESLAVNLIDVLNMYVNQTGVRLTFTAADGFSARMTGEGAYTGEAFFTLGATTCEEGIYMVNITPVGSAKIDVDLFNKYVRINNNNSVIKPAVSIKDNENGTYTISFDYSSLN